MNTGSYYSDYISECIQMCMVAIVRVNKLVWELDYVCADYGGSGIFVSERASTWVWTIAYTDSLAKLNGMIWCLR